MIDLHCHLLPGIDDGPKTMEQAVAMAKYAVEQGIQRCVLTPHIQPGCYDNSIETIQPVFNDFKIELQNAEIALQIEMAAEVRVCAELPLLIAQNKIPFLGQWQGKKVILLEFPHDHIPMGTDKLVKWLIDRDILPLIAHPERNQAIMQQPKKLNVFVDMGCLLQITADSITGLFGIESQKIALYFIEKKMATLIATDAHNLHKRKPSMQDAKQFLLSRVEEAYVTQLTKANAELILA